MTRISIKKLREYNHALSERDKDILHSIQKCGFIKTSQVGRLHFGEASTPASALRSTSYALAKLHKMGLVQPLRRRIGGVRAGSSSYVWTLREAGVELLRLCENNPKAKQKPRKRVHEPTYIFLRHTLAIAELYTYLRTNTKLIKAEFEPSCWRGYTTMHGVNVTLKPDLYAITTANGYEDHWFFEVDLDTEAPSRIMRKCESYGRYCISGQEQEKHNVFPQVVWIVPTEKRKQTLIRYIADNLSEYADLFVVITFEDLPALLQSGALPVHNTSISGNKIMEEHSVGECRP